MLSNYIYSWIKTTNTKIEIKETKGQ